MTMGQIQHYLYLLHRYGGNFLHRDMLRYQCCECRHFITTKFSSEGLQRDVLHHRVDKLFYQVRYDSEP